jgi:hypothetical protein
MSTVPFLFLRHLEEESKRFAEKEKEKNQNGMNALSST